MLLNTTANLGIIVTNIYLLFTLNDGFLEKEDFSTRQVLLYIGLETVIGILLMNFSTVILHTRIDFRFLLYAISMKYLGARVTVPTMLLVAAGRFLFDVTTAAWVNALVVLFMAVTLPLVAKWSKRRYCDLGQWIVLMTYTLCVTFASLVYLLPGLEETAYIFFVVSLSSYTLAFIAYKIIHDMQRMLKMVNTDELTGLWNRKKFNEDLARFEEQKKSIAVIALDIDHFKRYNDSFGHALGDKVLQKVAKVFSNLGNTLKRCYRVGGEEFVVLVADDNPDVAYHFAKKLQQHIRHLSVSTADGQVLKVTVSIGVAYQKENETLRETCDRADRALYEAKRNGRDQISIT